VVRSAPSDDDTGSVGVGPTECGTCGAVVSDVAAEGGLGHVATFRHALQELKRREMAATPLRPECVRALGEASCRIPGEEVHREPANEGRTDKR